MEDLNNKIEWDETKESWGKYPRSKAVVRGMVSRNQGFDEVVTDLDAEMAVLPYGQGRSYGDSCLNDQNILISTDKLNRFIEFNRETGVLRAEAGLTFKEILDHIVPQGWFLPVVPGTQFVTLGGAIANDIHGKNHHVAGTFGRHVKSLELLRSDGSRRICSAKENSDWFNATIGGLGLTGIIVWAEIQLKKISGPWISRETVRFAHLARFFELTQESD